MLGPGSCSDVTACARLNPFEFQARFDIWYLDEGTVLDDTCHHSRKRIRRRRQ